MGDGGSVAAVGIVCCSQLATKITRFSSHTWTHGVRAHTIGLCPAGSLPPLRCWRMALYVMPSPLAVGSLALGQTNQGAASEVEASVPLNLKAVLRAVAEA